MKVSEDVEKQEHEGRIWNRMVDDQARQKRGREMRMREQGMCERSESE